ncbi:hypothetical protein HG536_0C05500 [Torulaspora globosa]|uniref:RNA helicase n=1 Tax=Torulaspora globosa TaxID=48254 RepID=A0A7G3ZFU5_9SACH|nr:uncharacterized protein HG536_0C05500 [Torulaspora globosa]QLL32381.1 hypothetical protein HG536_0C05500 [Torulaspora globosa]
MAKKGKVSSKKAPSPDGGNKKGKGKSPPEEPSEKDQRKAKQQANRAKVASSASWTGKLPHTLLHEFCQKRKWNKVEYDMKKIGDKGLVAISVISYTDPKSKETLTIKLSDPTYDKRSGEGLLTPQETPMEARHYAATVALCRLAYNTNMHMMLPPNHKKLWHELSDYRASIAKVNAYRCERLFNSDPFKTLVDDRKLMQQREKELESKNKQAEKEQKPSMIISLSKNDRRTNQSAMTLEKKLTKRRTPVGFSTTAWENAVFVDLDESVRQMLETMLKTNLDWMSRRADLQTASQYERKALRGRLLSLNFREPHVEEAMAYKDPLSFLLFNLPEDDLPSFFHKRKEDSMNKVEITALPLAVRNKVDRLVESGVSKDEALFALESSDMSENEAAGRLTEMLYPRIDYNSTQFISEAESIEVWNQELESLRCIYEDSINIIEADSCYTIEIFKELRLKLKVYRTRQYPRSLPGIIVSTFEKGYKLPNYIKQQILCKLLESIYESNLLGDMLVYHVYEWLQDNMKRIIENPGPLLSEKALHRSLVNKSNNSVIDTKAQRKGQSRARETKTLSDQALGELKERHMKRLEEKAYQQMLKHRAKLPAWHKKELIVELVQQNNVTLITGETGSGKSTQVVQFLLDSMILGPQISAAQRIICSQPRRISAIGLAERVADERCVDCGEEVGYIIRGVNKTKKTTRIEFMTTGVLVRILQSDKSVLENAIVVIDEVHERSIDTDLIVILLKNLIGKIPGLKVVLMSATVDVEVFKQYFLNLATCHIEGRTFPIKDYFLEDVLDALDFTIRRDKSYSYSDDEDIQEEFFRPSADCKFFNSGQINYDLVCQVVFHADKQLRALGNDGSIIVFLPGVAEINQCCSMIISNDVDESFVVLPLHSALTPDEQRRVFRRYPLKRKIVVSTNIAETSITIDDCVATIDTGRAKTMVYDPRDNTTRLIESFISKAEVKQRRGRAGRVREGISYKLFSKRLYEENMVPMPKPEISRISLESLFISVKAMGIKDVKNFLSTGLEPPPAESIDKAAKILTTVGLLDDFDGSLTELGKFISLMPTMDSKHGKLLLYSIIFGVAEAGILLTSMLSTGSMPFIGGLENRDKIRSLLKRNESNGDLIAVCEILKQYLEIRDHHRKTKFMKDNYLSYNKVKEILSAQAQYLSILKDIGFLPLKKDDAQYAYLNRNDGNLDVLKAVIAGAFYPHVARVQLPDAKFLATSSGAIEKDPELKAIKLWIRNEKYIDYLQDPHESPQEKPLPSTRAFLHPSSILFEGTEASSEEIRTLIEGEEPFARQGKINALVQSPFIAFNTAQVTSKLFLRDVTPTSALSLLLMGGPLNYEINERVHSPGIVVDSWLPIRTWCKNAVLIKELRLLLDQAIRDKLQHPRYATGLPDNEQSRADKVLETVEYIFTIS